jgi:hypothetical protein
VEQEQDPEFGYAPFQSERDVKNPLIGLKVKLILEIET